MKANAIRLYNHFCEMIENPKGSDGLERSLVRKNAIKAKANMEEHFKKSSKYANDADIQKLLGTKPEPKTKPKEKEEDGKKPKR